MRESVAIESDHFRMTVWPGMGGKVSSLIDKADGFELFYLDPRPPAERGRYDSVYEEGWFAGWDECFPAVGASAYPLAPYAGIGVPDHGELWALPTTSVPTRDGVTTVWHGLRFGYRMTRKLWLDGNCLRAGYTLVNLAPFGFRFVWAAHPLLSVEVPVKLDFAQGASWRLSHEAGGVEVQRAFVWPRDGALDFSDPATLPAGRGWKLFSDDAIRAPAQVRYPTRGRTLEVAYGGDGAPAAYWGVWINSGGWRDCRHLAIEPTTGRFDQLDRSHADGSTAVVPAGGTLAWSMSMTTSAGL